MADTDVDSVAEHLAEPKPVKTFIPYFNFRVERVIDKLIITVCDTSHQISGLQYELKGNTLFFDSCEDRPKICRAQILLPIKVVHPTSRMPVSVDDSALPCFHIEFEIVPGFLLPSRRFSECPYICRHIDKLRLTEPRSVEDLDLDVITPHLSWHNRTIREPPSSSLEGFITDLIREVLNPKVGYRRGRYGFACRHHTDMAEYELDLYSRNFLEVPEPEYTDPSERRLVRWNVEKNAFDLDHYLADFFLQQNEHEDREFFISSMIHFRPYWDSLKLASEYPLTPTSMTLLAGLPSKDFSLNKQEREEVLHSLFDIMLAYAYEFRLCHLEAYNPESCWNICKLSATLSSHQVHRHPGDAMESFMRRSLVFPAFRNWLLSTTVYKDVVQIFSLGRRQILNCLVHIHELLENDPDRKFLNVLYIEDYLIWIQQVHPNTIVEYLELIKQCGMIKKEDVFEKLPQMEQMAIQMLKESDFDQYEEWHKINMSLEIVVKTREINKKICPVPYDYSSESDDSDSDDSSASSTESSDSDDSTSDLSKVDTASVEDSCTLPKSEGESSSKYRYNCILSFMYDRFPL